MLLEGRVIGLVEDDEIMGESLVQSLTLEGCHVDWWKSGQEALRALRVSTPDLVVCDIRLPDIRGDDLFRQLASTMAVPPFLFVTAFGDIDQAVSIMRAGGGDYVTKPFAMPPFIMRACSLIQRHPVSRPEVTLGVSQAMQEIQAVIERISGQTSPVLIIGETGAGKEVCARYLHKLSPRSKEPFVAVNCAAIPPDLMERELFGYRGAGPQGFHRGFAERTRGGVLFLDEIGELPAHLQAKLLRLVETREYHRVGGEQLMVFHGRIVCSTNADLMALIREGRFREDFYYRINVMRVDVPPLRERQDDIPWLIDQFVDQFKGSSATPVKGVSTLAHEAAMEHDWPGNVRELRNRIERALMLASGEWIMPADLFPESAAATHV
ncbi:MAG: sigma-54-dependent Fis family transcriptional regulator, partial [Rhizobiales bacterium]|nr:sigma-54-dependent Fis family transcriptional regulator [Hyphomicrobiales bacterium]